MTVVLSVGGSVLAPDLDPGRVAAYARAIEDLHDQGYEPAVVVGGGPTAREYISTARDLGANEMELDDVGIAVTRLNARLLVAALDDRSGVAPAESYREARETLRRGEVPVLGGITPAQTTDAVSAAFAEYADADLVVYATSVAGVFDADPTEQEQAHKYDELTTGDLVALVADLEMNAGSNVPVDLLAAKVLDRAGLRAVVLDGTDPDQVAAAVTTGTHGGTEVRPATGE